MLLWLSACSGPPAPEPPPDILVVVLDTVRADRLRLYGHGRDTSYQLEALAESGVVFDDVTVSGTWTWPGHAELFTGLSPWEHGAHYVPGVPHYAGLRPEVPTLAERMGQAGYRTTLTATNELLGAELDLSRGFDHVSTHRTDADTVAAFSQVLAAAGPEPELAVVNLLSSHAPWFVRHEVPWSEAHREPLMAAEGALGAMRQVDAEGVGVEPSRACPSGLRCDVAYAADQFELTDAERALIGDLYDSGLVQTDNALRAVIQAWLSSGHSGVVVVTSDHGEFLGEHDMLQHRFVTQPEVLHIPLVIAGQGIPAGQRVSQPVQLKHVHDTLLELAGVADPAWSLLDAMQGVEHGSPITAMGWPFDGYAPHARRLAERWIWYREGDHAVAVHGDQVEPWSRTGGTVPPDTVARLEAGARALPADLDLRPSAIQTESQAALLQALGYVDAPE